MCGNDQFIKKGSKYMEEKIKAEQLISKLKNIASRAKTKKKYNEALSAIEVCAGIQYFFNQTYVDQELEDILLQMSDDLVTDYESNNKGNVIFYDGFGMDTRGLEINYCKSIVNNGYKLFYITLDKSRYVQPRLKHELKDFDVRYIYINTNGNYLLQIDQLNKIFLDVKPENAFFYTLPYDVIGTIVFNKIKKCTSRFQLDLTDHAFWLGVNAFDYCLNSRDVGQSIQLYERRIPIEKIVRIKPSPYIDTLVEFKKLPFDTSKYKFIFSGGALYKTLGDSENIFYHVVSELLTMSDVKFVYAGNGDKTEIDKLIQKYPDQVFYYGERPDFYEIIKECTLYLNTYPMFGGLMTRYAALAGKIPLTIKHGNESDGLLINQEDRRIEYDDAESLISDAKKLLTDDRYLMERENLLKGSVVDFEEFSRNLNMLMMNHQTEYETSFIEVDTKKFREEYLNRFNLVISLSEVLPHKRHFVLIKYFPILFTKSLLSKISKKIKERVK